MRDPMCHTQKTVIDRARELNLPVERVSLSRGLVMDKFEKVCRDRERIPTHTLMHAVFAGFLYLPGISGFGRSPNNQRLRLIARGGFEEIP